MLNKDLNLIRISYSYLILISNRLHSNSLIFELYSNISLLNFGSETVRRVVASVGWLVGLSVIISKGREVSFPLHVIRNDFWLVQTHDFQKVF